MGLGAGILCSNATCFFAGLMCWRERGLGCDDPLPSESWQPGWDHVGQDPYKVVFSRTPTHSGMNQEEGARVCTRPQTTAHAVGSLPLCSPSVLLTTVGQMNAKFHDPIRKRKKTALESFLNLAKVQWHFLHKIWMNILYEHIYSYKINDHVNMHL